MISKHLLWKCHSLINCQLHCHATWSSSFVINLVKISIPKGLQSILDVVIHFLTPIPHQLVHSQIALWFELVRLIGPWWTLYRWFVWECSREGCLQLLRINMTTIWPISHFLCSQWTIFKIKFLNCFYILFLVENIIKLMLFGLTPLYKKDAKR